MGTASEWRSRCRAFDWEGVARALDREGYARLPGLLAPAECAAVARLWEDERRFRSVVHMARHGHGEGEYRYFGSPVPQPVRSLRTQLYPPLARIANRWQERLGRVERYPARWSGMRAVCDAAEQRRPTPLLLRYRAGGYNCLHQDRYGVVAFPLQVVVQLSAEDAYAGGAFLLVEQRPRRQSRAEAVELARGEALVFPNAERPVEGRRGVHRVRVRHGVSTITAGERTALGLIFHEAR